MPVHRFGLPRRAHTAAILGATLTLAGCVSSSPTGANAVTTGAVNMRAGPGTRFAVVTSVPSGTVLAVYGCLQDGTWCDASTGNTRGWVSARYLSASQAAYAPVAPIYPVISFGFWGDSWDDSWHSGGGGFRRNDPL